MAGLVFEFEQLYARTFGVKPSIGKEEPTVKETGFTINDVNESYRSSTGSQLQTTYFGRDIWLPIRFTELDKTVFGVTDLLLPYATLNIKAKKTIVETPMFERKGSVKEVAFIDDYMIQVKGFLVGYSNNKMPQFPEEDLKVLHKLFTKQVNVGLDNAITNVLLDTERLVVISSLDILESGGKKNIIPFSMSIMSDSIFTLEVE